MANNGVVQIILVVAVAFLGLYVLQNYSKSTPMLPLSHENFVREGYDNDVTANLTMPQQCGSSCAYEPSPQSNDPGTCDGATPPTCPTPVVSQCEQDMMYQDPAYQQLRQASCFPRSQLSPEELLPQDNCSLWAQVNPQGSGSLKDRNFLQAGWATGVSTVGSTLRNANRQLRSEPPNPQVKVSPWLQTTVEPDIARKPFEIGGCS
jgi:hypothetical protein